MSHAALVRRLAGAALVATAALAPGAPALAATPTTVAVHGRQVVVDEAKGTYKMTGSLRGDWTTTSFKELATSPLYRAEGTESFSGCLDLRRDGSCAGDPAGTLTFSFLYWGHFSGETLIWGSCWHPVKNGTGAFAGADGVLTMVDTPTAAGVKTSYIGNLTLKARSAGTVKSKRATAAQAKPACRPGR